MVVGFHRFLFLLIRVFRKYSLDYGLIGLVAADCNLDVDIKRWILLLSPLRVLATPGWIDTSIMDARYDCIVRPIKCGISIPNFVQEMIASALLILFVFKDQNRPLMNLLIVEFNINFVSLAVL